MGWLLRNDSQSILQDIYEEQILYTEVQTDKSAL